MKEGILEQLADDYIKFSGFFTNHNVKFLPSSTDRNTSREKTPLPVILNPAFERYIGIDYSGAQPPSSSLKGLRLYLADRLTNPRRVEPP
jgi:hypothetical protein